MTKTTIRPVSLDDIPAVGRIIYRAFATSFRRHGYAEPVASPEAGAALSAATYAADPGAAILLQAASGRPLGVAFAQRCPDVAYVGPIAVAPEAQGLGHGRRLLDEILTLIGDLDARLLQDSFNPVSFRLYARAGFEVRETLALVVTGPGGPSPGSFPLEVGNDRNGVWSLRDVDARDMPLIAELDRAAGGVDRSELLARVAPRLRGAVLDGPKKPRGFACAFPASGMWVMGPGWAEDGQTLAAILVGLAQRCAKKNDAVTTFAPASRADLLSAMIEIGFHVSHLVNLMVRGSFTPFRDACLPVLPIDVAAVE